MAKIERKFDSNLAKPSDNYIIIKGPSFLSGLPSEDEWSDFIESINDPVTKEFAQVWMEKSKQANGVPLRNDFDFKTLVKYGKRIIMYKRTEEGRWLTTFCGDTVVEELNLELSNKYLDDYADEETIKFWMDNIQYITQQCRPIYEISLLSI